MKHISVGVGLALLLSLSCAAGEVKVQKPYFKWLFGGFGFQHSEANFEALMSDEFRDQRVLKTFAEISPTFGRVYTGFSDQSKEQMDRFSAYYHKTFAKAGTTLYAVPCALPHRAEDSPVSPDEYAAKVAKSLDYLINARDCRKIRYYCLSNELMTGDRWGWFDRTKNMGLFKKWNVALFDAFKRQGLDLLLIGSDVSLPSNVEEGLAVQKWCADNMDEWLGAYVSHWYVYGYPLNDLSLWSKYGDYFNKEVQLALSKAKRYILGEYGFCPVWGKPGVMVDDVGHWKRQPETVAEGALCKCEVGLAAMNAGAYGCISWSFVDYPDPFPCDDGNTPLERARYEAGRCAYRPDLKYNKWGLFRWNDVDKDYSAAPELYVLGHLARLFRKGASVLPCASDDGEVRTGAVLNPDRSFSVAMINRGAAKDFTVDCSAWFGRDVAEPKSVARRYVYEANNPPVNPFNDLQPAAGTVAIKDGKLSVRLPAKSVTFLTTDYEDRTPAPVASIKLEGTRLIWQPVASEDHRYYRVFANGRQIASTVATGVTVSQGVGQVAYEVRSVDKWGNVGSGGVGCAASARYQKVGCLGASAAANRAAIQGAVDSVHAAGGGVVTVPPGTWPTGSIQLKSGVELHLEKGATLLGSTDRRDYNANDVFPGNRFSVAEEWSGGHLVWAYQAHDIAVTGEGTIDGNGPAFFGDCDEDSRFPWYKYGLKLHPIDTEWYRPGQMLAFYQVKNLRLENVTLANTTAWTCHVRCSDGLVARGVKILADRTIANSDGFSIDCTRNVLIEKCTIKTGDDSFAIRASCVLHGATNVCENLVIRDCDVWSCCYAFRFGIGGGDIRKALVENCRIHESVDGFGFTPSWVRGERGVHIRDVTVRNCTMREGDRPISVSPGESKSCVSSIRFENCRFEGLHPSWIGGNGYCEVSDVLITNCTYRRIGKLKVRHRGMSAESLERARTFVLTNDCVRNLRTVDCTPGPVRPGVLVLAFDDRNFADWERALPLFAKYDAHATFFISGEIGADVIGSVKRLVKAGHAVGLHGQHHRNAPEAIREKGYGWYRSTEIDHPRHQLEVSLLSTFCFAYPNNARTYETDNALYQHFHRLRAGVPGAAPYDPEGTRQAGLVPLHENDALFFPVDELRKHRVISGAIIGEAYHTKIDEVLKCLERAAKNREVVEFTSHGISPDAKNINMKTEWLEAILAKARTLGLEVLSFDELDRP